jgi:hypothetical protein
MKKKEKRGYQSLLEGEEVEISGDGLDLIIKSQNKKTIYTPEDIKGFIFGGFSSRFWLMKNYINTLNPSSMTHPGLFCWNMISI